jgi:Cu2+-exporting ATPase
MPAGRSCFHCGEPVPVAPLYAELDGRREAVCCAGCAAATELIAGGGFGAYYAHREAFAPRPAAAPDPTWLAFDRPALAAELIARGSDGTRALSLLVEGVRCAACAWLVERALGAVPGVRRAQLNPVSARLVLELDAEQPALSTLFGRLAALGYRPHPGSAATEAASSAERRELLKRLAVAGLGAMQTMMYGVALWFGLWSGMDPATRRYLEWVSLLITTPVVLYAAAPFLRGALAQLAARRPGMDLPIALAVLLAYAASVWNTLLGAWPVYYDSLSMFVFLLLVGRYLELAARAQAGDVAGSLARLLPTVATRLDADGPRSVGRIELLPGDRVLVRPGEVVPSDAELLDREAQLDESLLTGESAAVSHRVGAELIGGSVNLGGPFEARVLRVGARSLVAQVGGMLARAQAERPPTALAADRVALGFVVAVLTLAGATALWWWQADAGRAVAVTLAVLIATCPCALGLAMPAAHTCATGCLARAGVFITRGRALDALAGATDVAFDKTGTLTLGRPVLERTELLRADLDERTALALAAALERASEHALARAFPSSSVAATAVAVVPGCGVEGEVAGRRLRIGQPAWVEALAADGIPASHDPDGAAEGASVALLGDAGGPLARFVFRDALREDAAATVRSLRAFGLGVHLWSGDAAGPVARIAAELGIADARHRLSPAGKLAALRALQAQGRRVLVVGDGVNDAPVLAGADAAVAIGRGSGLAQAQADAVLAGERLAPVALALRHARRTRGVVRQNLGWALAYNLVVLPVAALGLLEPWFAALGMSASSLLVVANALRLREVDAVASRPPAFGSHRLLARGA